MAQRVGGNLVQNSRNAPAETVKGGKLLPRLNLRLVPPGGRISKSIPHAGGTRVACAAWNS